MPLIGAHFSGPPDNAAHRGIFRIVRFVRRPRRRRRASGRPARRPRTCSAGKGGISRLSRGVVSAAPARGGDRPDISRADFTYCLLAIDWGLGRRGEPRADVRSRRGPSGAGTRAGRAGGPDHGRCQLGRGRSPSVPGTKFCKKIMRPLTPYCQCRCRPCDRGCPSTDSPKSPTAEFLAGLRASDTRPCITNAS